MQHLIKLLDQGMEFANRAGRQDLQRKLKQTKDGLEDASVRVIVVGELKQGKSRLVNALLNAPICPVEDDIATAVPTTIRFGELLSAAVLTDASTGELFDVDAADTDRTAIEPPELQRTQVELPRFAQYVSKRGIHATAAKPGDPEVKAAEVTLPRKLLQSGLTIIDTPGVSGLGSAKALATIAAIPSAHAMIFVSDASQEYTKPEIQFLQHVMRISPNVICVLAKTDMYPEWREIEKLDRERLRAINPAIPLFPVSSHLRFLALQSADSELNVESGFPELITHLRRELIGRAEILRHQSATAELLATTGHVNLAIQSELSALRNPEQAPKIVSELQATKGHAEKQRRLSSRWQTALSDGINDLIADMEHDLRDRMRLIQREAEDSIDEGDPGPIWGEIVEWLRQRASSSISDTFVWTQQRTRWLTDRVARHFAEYEVSLPLIRIDTREVLDSVAEVADLDSGRLGFMQKFYIGLKGSYGGVLMVGIITGIVGMSLINPLSLAAGAVIGRKAYRDDQSARLQRRRNEAKSIVRRHVDDVIFQVSKHLRDSIRLAQRITRDHFTTIADEQQRSLSDSVAAAQKAASTYTAERDKRITALCQSLESLEAFRKRVHATGNGTRTRAARHPNTLRAPSSTAVDLRLPAIEAAPA